MQTLILGAGGTGGYFGARLLEAGQDVTFLVRPRRAEQLKNDGLVVLSQFGDMNLQNPSITIKADRPYELVILSCKAYDLESSIQAIRGAVGKDTCILPLLNGMAHFEKLRQEFGAEKILGGLCIISATIEEGGRIRHLNDTHTVKFGEFSGEMSQRVKQIAEAFKSANAAAIASEHILQDIWEKWLMIATLAAITTLMRASLGDILSAPNGVKLAEQLLEECMATLRANGQELRPAFIDSVRSRMTDRESTLKASMLRDMESGSKIEADQIIGDLIAKAAAKDIEVPLLRVCYCNLKAYEIKRSTQVNKA